MEIFHEQIVAQFHYFFGGFWISWAIYQILKKLCYVPWYVNSKICFPQHLRIYFFNRERRCRKEQPLPLFRPFFVPWAHGACNIKWYEACCRLDVDIIYFFITMSIMCYIVDTLIESQCKEWKQNVDFCRLWWNFG